MDKKTLIVLELTVVTVGLAYMAGRVEGYRQGVKDSQECVLRSYNQSGLISKTNELNQTSLNKK